MDYDFVIVDRGMGGSGLACAMAQANRKVLVLEKQSEYVDRVHGEWIAPWGVTEIQKVGLYGLLMRAGGHHITYDESLDPEFCESSAQPPGLQPGRRDDTPFPGTVIPHDFHCGAPAAVSAHVWEAH